MPGTRHEMYNTRTGQRKVVHRSSDDTGGEVCRIESWNEPHMPAEPDHRHPYQSTTFWIYSGSLGFHIDGKEYHAGAGESMVVPANAVHHFWNDGDVVAHHMQEFRPALHIDRLFETLFGLANEGKLDARGMPSLLQLAVMLPEYHRENRPARPPFWLLLPLALLLWPVAYLLGYRATYPRYHQFPETAGVEGGTLGAPTAQATEGAKR